MLKISFKMFKNPKEADKITNPPIVEPIAIAKNDLFQFKSKNQLKIEAV